MSSQNSNARKNKNSKSNSSRARKTKKNGNNNNNDGGMSLTSAPTSLGITSKTIAPVISRGGKSMRIKHRELVSGSIAGSTTFTVQSFLKINPGLAATFPWLAPQAAQWEQYRVHSLVIEWIPIAPTSTQGDIIISPNYDASDPQPTTETQAVDNYGSLTFSVWKTAMLTMDVGAMMGLGPRRFVRQSAVAGDPKTFDVATVAICSNNETGTSTVGKLFVSYDFEFFIPQNDPSTATVPQQTSVFSLITSNQTFTTNSAGPLQWNGIVFDPLSIGAATAGVFTPPAGVYFIHTVCGFRDTSNEAFTAVLQLFKNGASLTIADSSEIGPISVSASGNLSLALIGVVPFNGTDTFQIQVTLVGAAGTLTATANQCNLIISLA
jgi:hypothetical protein